MARPACDQCGRPRKVCYCHKLVRMTNRREVVVLRHPAEARHILGTAAIAVHCLERCQLLPLHERELPAADPALARRLGRPALIYPGPGSQSLEELRAPAWRDRPLLFIDASWRKSRRFLHQSPWLAGLPRFSVAPHALSRYRIRREPRADYCSTLEAIVQVLECLENAPGRYRPLLDVMDWMVERQIELMGENVFRRHYPAAGVRTGATGDGTAPGPDREEGPTGNGDERDEGQE